MNISRNYHRGKSFRFSNWCPGITYKNDEYTQDFVKYKNALYACKISFTTKVPDKSTDWELVIENNNSVLFVPNVDENGNLTWTNNSNLENPKAVNLKGPSGTDGKDGQDGSDGLSAYQIWLNVGNSGTELDFLKSLKGDSGTQNTEWGFWKN